MLDRARISGDTFVVLCSEAQEEKLRKVFIGATRSQNFGMEASIQLPKCARIHADTVEVPSARSVIHESSDTMPV